MENNFEDTMYKDIFTKNKTRTGNLIKSTDVEVSGLSRISFQDDEVDGGRILLKKDPNDNLKEIKFVCSCGQTKTVILDYTE
ncbi:MAG: hypothetical protein HZA74_01585 [Ignavibacteriales bacterium]|jgi:hypothetical protein|nr:hypothetical protein [Ignavibacteriales bacterium]